SPNPVGYSGARLTGRIAMLQAVCWVAFILAVVALLRAAPDPPVPNTPPAGELEGKWEFGNTWLTVKGGRLGWEMNGAGGRYQFDADFSVTKDSLLYGVVTATRHQVKDGGQAPGEDDTFSFRFRVDGDELSVRGVRGHGLDGPEVKKWIEGRY